MEDVCYLCNQKVEYKCHNIKETLSKHSSKPIIEFIEKFLQDFESQRDINDETNGVCSGCLCRILSYDWMCLKINDEERDLKRTLIRTENDFIAKKKIKQEKFFEEIDVKNNENFEEIDSKKEDDKSVIEKNLTAISPTIKPIEPVKKSKPIIIRVVKRVPFLKKPATQPASGQSTDDTKKLSQIITKTNSGLAKTSTNNSVPSSLTKKITSNSNEIVPKIEKKHICKYCDMAFAHESWLTVSKI